MNMGLERPFECQFCIASNLGFWGPILGVQGREAVHTRHLRALRAVLSSPLQSDGPNENERRFKHRI